MIHIASHPEINKRPVEAAVLRRQSRPIVASLPISVSGVGAQGDPCTATILWFIMHSPSAFLSCLIHSLELRGSNQQKPSSETGRNLARNGLEFCRRSISHTAVQSCDMRPTALLPLRLKAWYGFLSPLRIYRPRPGFNLSALGPVVSTITIRPPRTTIKI
jgi:hypothetical protein